MNNTRKSADPKKQLRIYNNKVMQYNRLTLVLFVLWSFSACQSSLNDRVSEKEGGVENSTLVQEKVVEEFKFQSGDIMFHSSQSSQSEAIQLATNSLYSHVGIVYSKKEAFFVYEAIEPVKMTPIRDWIDRGKDKHYVVKRLKDHRKLITASTLSRMEFIGKRYLGKHYDQYFNWSDNRVYCSELVWKIYKKALNIELCPLQKMGDLDLTAPIVQQKIRERYGANPPLDEPVVSPAALFDSEKLMTVKEE